MRVDPAAYNDEREWVQIAILMLNDGYTGRAVARELDISYNRLANAMHPDDQRRSRKNRRGQRSICTRCKQPMSYLSSRENPVCKPCERKHARRHDPKIAELWEQDWQADEIAAVLGDMTPLEVNHRVNAMRLYQGIALAKRV